MNNGETFYIGRRKVTQHAPESEDIFWEWTVGRYWVAYEETPNPPERVLLIAEPNKEDRRRDKEYGDRSTSDAWLEERLRFKYEGYDLDELKAMSLLIKFLDGVKTNKTEGAKDD